MIREYLQWSKSKNEIVRFLLWNDPPKQYHSIVHRSKGQNEMRRVLSALQKTKRHGISIIPNNDEMYIHRENGGYYSLWVYTDNWQGWASFLAGVLVGKGVI